MPFPRRKIENQTLDKESSDPQLWSCNDNDPGTFSDLNEREEFELDLHFGVNDFTFMKFETKEQTGLKHYVDQILEIDRKFF